MPAASFDTVFAKVEEFRASLAIANEIFFAERQRASCRTRSPTLGRPNRDPDPREAFFSAFQRCSRVRPTLSSPERLMLGRHLLVWMATTPKVQQRPARERAHHPIGDPSHARRRSTATP